MAVREAPAVVRRGADGISHDGATVEGDVRVGKGVGGVARPGPIEPGPAHGSSQTPERDGAAAHVPQSAHTGGDEIRLSDHVTEVNVVGPDMFASPADDAEDADGCRQPAAINQR